MTITPTEHELRLFVRKNADYYLEQWSSLLSDDNDQKNKLGFNIAAFFLTGFWLPYRKMYKVTFIVYGIILAISILEYFIYLGKEPPPFSNAWGIIIGFICGNFGNRWYYDHTCEKIAEIRRLNLSEEERNKLLKKWGGTSLLASIGFTLMFFVAMFLVMLILILLFEGVQA